LDGKTYVHLGKDYVANTNAAKHKGVLIPAAPGFFETTMRRTVTLRQDGGVLKYWDGGTYGAASGTIGCCSETGAGIECNVYAREGTE
jgi:hypothetical protein